MDNAQSTGSRQVVEHAVLFNMPHLQADQEAFILQGLHDLQFEFKKVLRLSTGRILSSENFCTHAIIVRLPSTAALLEYYESAALYNIAQNMIPSLQNEFTVDYMASVTDEQKQLNRKAVLQHLTFLKVKEGVSLEAVEDMLQSLSAMAEKLDYIIEFTAGSNMYVRDKLHSHAFTAYLASDKSLESLQNDSSYIAVLQDKALPICSKIRSVNFWMYRPEQSTL